MKTKIHVGVICCIDDKEEATKSGIYEVTLEHESSATVADLARTAETLVVETIKMDDYASATVYAFDPQTLRILGSANANPVQASGSLVQIGYLDDLERAGVWTDCSNSGTVDLLRNSEILYAALQGLLDQVNQMRGLFSDSDNTISAAVIDAVDAMTTHTMTKAALAATPATT
jgi:hypothetical protein